MAEKKDLTKWICFYCNKANSLTAFFCQHCLKQRKVKKPE